MEKLKEMLEEKYSTTLQNVDGGFIVPGLLTIIYEPELKTAQERFKILENLATDVWANPKMYKSLADSWIESQNDMSRTYLAIQKRLAHQIRNKPNIETFEIGEFAGLHYIVSNDFFTEACM